jgi:S-adenosylmethionine decarboxylase
MNTGHLWVIDAFGCNAEDLRSRERLDSIFRAIVLDMELHPVGEPRWHRFPGAAGLTGYWMLSESHLACHTYPEDGFAAFDLYCCRDLAEWPWGERLAGALGAADVKVTRLERGKRLTAEGHDP